MIQSIPIAKIKCYKGQECLDELQRNHKECIEQYAKEKIYKDNYIILDKSFFLVDGHHKFLAAILNKEKNINCIVLNVSFEATDILRDFQKHLKWMQPENYDYKIELKKEFEKVIVWLVNNIL